MPRGKHREGYKRPRLHDERKQRKPLTWDRLPRKLREAVIFWKEEEGRTWKEAAELAAELARELECEVPSEKELRTGVALRHEAQRREALERNERYRELYAAFAARGIKNLPEATVQALAGESAAAMSAAKTPAARQAAMVNFGIVLAKLLSSQAAADRVALEREKLEARKQQREAVSPREIFIKAAEDILKALRTRKEVRAVIDPISKELVEEFSKRAESFAKQIEAQSA